MKKLSGVVAIALLAASPIVAQKSSAQAGPGEERYVGYYYPKPLTTEATQRRVRFMACLLPPMHSV